MRRVLVSLGSMLLVACSSSAQTNDELREQVRARETAFAKTMADRDHAAFVTFLSDEAIFVGRTVLRGKAKVAEGWKRLYEGKDAPFAWAPELVEVVDSGTLAMSSGPVLDPSGKRVGTFKSTWRREADGVWRIVLDSGCPPCDCAQQAAPPAPPAPPAGARAQASELAQRSQCSGWRQERSNKRSRTCAAPRDVLRICWADG
jgi:ketosteroid isomerase-like protein